MTTKDQVIKLREAGKTYGEIQSELGIIIPKGTLSYWCKNIALPPEYKKRIAKLMAEGLNKSRASALAKKQEIKELEHRRLVERYSNIAGVMDDEKVALIALAMLCLGEASKSDTLYLGSSDERIIRLFLRLLKKCFKFDLAKVRCTVQCRADQNVEELKKYWMGVTGVPQCLFYKPQIDPRTIGKPTLNHEYKGVLKVNYFDSRVQKTLKVLYNLLADSSV